MSLEDRLYPLLAIYERLPERLKHLVGCGYRQLPVRWRLGRRYGQFQRLASEVEAWSPAQIESYQWERLRETLDHASRSCPFYRRRFDEAGFRPEGLQTLDDLQKCPLLTKQDVIENREAMVSTTQRKGLRLYTTTGGSTGVPVGFYLHKGVSRPKEQAFLEAQWARGGYVSGARLVVIRGHVTSRRAHGGISSYDAIREWLMLSSYHLTPERFPEYLEAIERFQPDFLHAYPSAALQLAEFLERSGQSLRVPLQGLLAGSERLTVPQKRLLERVFKCRVYRWYGHSERVVLAAEGRRSELFYFWPSYGLTELGPPDEDGLREVIGTSFHNLVMPLIRYRTGDYVRLADPARDGPLEFPWLAASEVTGREQEFLVTAGGRRISLTAFNMHDRIFDDLYAVQFYQEEAGRAEFRYVPGPNFQNARLELIAAGIRRKVGDDLEVTFRKVTETERTSRGKHCWLVSKLAAARLSHP